jgi:nucleoside-diphosphate-sugar epimerase
MRILVTGGAGMIGSHLVDALLARGDEVAIVDNFLTGRRENLLHLTAHHGMRVFVGDVTAAAGLLWHEGPFDRVYHLASPASPADLERYPLETLMTNAAGTRAVLDLAGRWGARFLLASSAEVYGDPERHPQAETDRGSVRPLGQPACYHDGKQFAESLTLAFCRTHGIDARIARVFETYGPRGKADHGRVVPTFCVQALTGQALAVHGSASQTRSLCYVEDVVRGLIALMERPGLRGEVVNIGCPEERPIVAIAREILALAANPSLIAQRPLPGDDAPRRCPDITKARHVLGWEPATSLLDGLRLTLAHFREELGLAPAAAGWPQRDIGLVRVPLRSAAPRPRVDARIA